MTCGQVGHKYKMVFKLITIFMEAERIILFNLTELTCDQVDHKLKWSNFRTTCPEVNCGQVGHNFRWFIYSQLLAIMARSKMVSKLDTIPQRTRAVKKVPNLGTFSAVNFWSI